MSLTFRLSALQWCQNSLYGFTVISLGTYLLNTLAFSGREVGLIYATSAIAATFTPPVVGWLADRRYRADLLLPGLYIAASLVLCTCFLATSFWSFYSLFLLFNLLYIPTFGLLNAVCFHQLEDPEAEYPFVRTWGTVGFMFVGLGLSYFGWETTAWPLIGAAATGLFGALFCIGLDPIPPQPGFKLADLRGPEVSKLTSDCSMRVLLIAMLLSCIPSAFYYSFVNPFLNEIGWSAAAAKMTLGQVVEIAVLLLMPLTLRRLRFRTVVFWGLFWWGARYFAFALGRPEQLEWLLYLGIIVQGFCFTWVVVAGQMYVDRRVPRALRSTAQGLISFVSLGAGMMLGSWIAGEVVGGFELAAGIHDWRVIWCVPGVIGVLTAAWFWWRFPKVVRKSWEHTTSGTAPCHAHE